ncbi:hypothetical protein JQS43_24345 [Natronosporangium hydrolyticum]|uniref:Uncharacterized protein n=1 Tax=Natronosporangium hydrolyticum TaxID=2811111 RepID=A0A895YIZ9_9ACTN|nr:hypothetical protein [Natronosporangium hydrolyticum]QSB14566.1 hypothetical protein JQS43_24345 [Natronosporangium hydrolyticum]
MKTLNWMAAASRRTLILAKPGAGTVTITPGRGGGWTVQTANRVVTVDAVRLEEQMEAWDFRGYREVPS